VTAWRSSDGGGSWKDVGKTLRVGKGHGQLLVKTFAFAARRQGVVYAGNIEGVFRSMDGGLSWRSCQVPRAASALAVDPGRPDTIWAGSIGTVFASDDSCATWRKLPATFGGKTVRKILFGRGAPGLTFVATAGGSVYWTDDRGKAFRGPVFEDRHFKGATSLAADRSTPRVSGRVR
jgi:hypothetical protein